jgi:hypothetical protein
MIAELLPAYRQSRSRVQARELVGFLSWPDRHHGRSAVGDPRSRGEPGRRPAPAACLSRLSRFSPRDLAPDGSGARQGGPCRPGRSLPASRTLRSRRFPVSVPVCCHDSGACSAGGRTGSWGTRATGTVVCARDIDSVPAAVTAARGVRAGAGACALAGAGSALVRGRDGAVGCGTGGASWPAIAGRVAGSGDVSASLCSGGAVTGAAGHHGPAGRPGRPSALPAGRKGSCGSCCGNAEAMI